MSLASIKTKQEQCLNDIYTSLEEQGATMPDKKNLVNVAPAIKSIEGGGSGPKFIDYIEGTGTQYIDTGFKPNNNTSIEMKVLIPDSQGGKLTRFFDTRNDSNIAKGSFAILSFDDSNSLLQFRYDTIIPSENAINEQLATDTEYIVRTEKNKLYVNDELKITRTASTFQTNYNLFLFAFKSPTELHAQDSIYRLYYFKIYDNDVLVRNFKPCIDPNGVYCLYDLVEGKYYYNQGTGEFRGEGWKPTQLEYIEPTGAQWIDTGFVPNSNTKVQAEFYLPTQEVNPDGTFLYGVRTSSGVDQYSCWEDSNPSQQQLIMTYGASTASRVKYVADSINTIIHDKNVFTVSSNSTEVTAQTFTCDYTMFIFNINNAGSTMEKYFPKPGTRLHSFKIYDNGTLVRDYIPALDQNNESGLWDKVNEVFYYNQGDGSFTAGPVVA